MRRENEPPDTHPSYDRHGLDGVCDGNEALRRRILVEFVRTAPGQVQQLLERLTEGSREEAQRIAHTLKGSSRTVGAFVLGDLCERIELGAGDLARERAQIGEELERVRREVERHLESIP